MYIHVKLGVTYLVKPLDSPFDLQGVGYCGCFNFRRTARAVTRLYDQAFQSAGIRSTQFSILVAVAKTQPTSIGDLADLMVIDSTTLTRSLGRLQKAGVLAVSPRGAKRQRFVTLTPKGEKFVADSLPAWRAAHERFVQALSAEHWIMLRADLERIALLAIDLEAGAKTTNQAA
jgi:DNA-binding MarR family transcriptional regulator